MMRHAPPILSTLYPMSRYERIPETSIAPENQLEVKMSFWDGLFSEAILVSGSVVTCSNYQGCDFIYF